MTRTEMIVAVQSFGTTERRRGFEEGLQVAETISKWLAEAEENGAEGASRAQICDWARTAIEIARKIR